MTAAMEELTPRQAEVLEYILRTLERRGYPPSVREICDDLGFSSTRGALRHLESLERKGFISRFAGARAIQVRDTLRGSVAYLPLVGEVPAGPLRYASEEVEEWMAKDPIRRFTDYLVAQGIIDERAAGDLEAEARRAIEDAVRYAEESPEPPVEEILEGVYA